MLKKLLVAVVLGAFVSGAMILAGCAKKKEEAENPPSMTDTSMGMPDTSMMADTAMTDTTMH